VKKISASNVIVLLALPLWCQPLLLLPPPPKSLHRLSLLRATNILPTPPLSLSLKLYQLLILLPHMHNTICTHQLPPQFNPSLLLHNPNTLLHNPRINQLYHCTVDITLKLRLHTFVVHRLSRSLALL
jgi:hypothetical protein